MAISGKVSFTINVESLFVHKLLFPALSRTAALNVKLLPSANVPLYEVGKDSTPYFEAVLYVF